MTEPASPASINPADIIWKHPAHVLALGFGSGLFPVAPGTVATLWAWVVFLMIDPLMSDWGWAILIGLGIWFGAMACTLTGRALQKPDASAMVWDEIIAFWIVLWVLPRASDPAGFYALGNMPEWMLQAIAFLLFRFFDIAKPPPIGAIDRRSKGGWGVMADDLVAAAYTLLCCAIALRAFHLLEIWR